MGNNLYKQRHKNLGLCTDCSEKALPGRTRCFTHDVNHRLWKEDPQKNHERTIKWKKYWEENGLCKGCGAELDIDSSKYCMNCRSNNYRPRWAYWHELRVRGICTNQ